MKPIKEILQTPIQPGYEGAAGWVAIILMLLIASFWAWETNNNIRMQTIIRESRQRQLELLKEEAATLERELRVEEARRPATVIAPIFDAPRQDDPERDAAYSRRLIASRIIEEALAYGINHTDALRIAECESSFDPRARNPRSSAKGIYQFTDTTWAWIKAPGNQFDYEENIRQFMIWYPQYPQWWECK
jgi:soluble lytic murein transglycosylase-like protein